MADGTELFEIIHTTRAMRRLRPDPVPDAVINRILETLIGVDPFLIRAIGRRV